MFLTSYGLVIEGYMVEVSILVNMDLKMKQSIYW